MTSLTSMTSLASTTSFTSTTSSAAGLAASDTELRNRSLPAGGAPEYAAPGVGSGDDLGRGPHPKGWAAIALSLAEQEAVWRPLLQVDPDRRWYTRLRAGDGWEAWLLSWLPGQGTDLHDHGGSAGAFTVLFGQLQELTPAPTKTDPIRMAARTLHTGEVRTFGRSHIHQVTGVGQSTAASLHVYGPALTLMNRYELDPERGAVLATTERAGQDW